MATAQRSSRDELVEIATGLARRFADRAADHDRDSTFPYDNYADLREAGLLGLTVPEELGGLGAGLGDVLAVLERLASGDGATTLAVTMHISPVGQWAAVWRRTGDERLAEMLRRAADGSLVWAALTAEAGVRNTMTDSRTTATRVDGGFVINGRKIFATNSAVATDFSTTARYEDAEGGPRLLLCQVSMAQEGVKIHPTWDALGMRATRSDDVEFTDVFVPDERVVHSLPVGSLDRRVLETVWSWAMPCFGAVYTGVAAGALDWTVERVVRSGRADDPVLQDVIGECRITLETSRAVLHRHVDDVQHGRISAGRVQEGLARCATAKYVAATNATQIVQRLVDVVGGPAFTRAFPFERMWRDVQAGPIMPMGNLAARRLVGADTLGVATAPEHG
ncbi:acyl-CoA dehydrogenase family protein [Pseudonocardia aurantiaca]|uniref:Dibenzothiophene monooxygenase n=1 Tax=Pseudonocardia aurantiaca TaxID=75290 RepID=A0ABW4FJF5_9PSEU